MGWGVVRAEGTRIAHVSHGIIHVPEDLPLAERLVQLHDELQEVLQVHRPEEGAVEALFFAKDVQAASKLGHARGVVLLALAKVGISVYEYAPARVKRAVSGRGRADKRQVALMVKALLGMRELPGADATDALAVAITHAQFSRVERVLRDARRH